MTLPRRVGFALVVTVLGLGAIEGLARVVEPGLTPPAPTLPTPAPGEPDAAFKQRQAEARAAIPMVAAHDDVGRWTLKPDQIHQEGNILVRSNSAGLRGPELTPKPPGELRLLTLGDSSIYGFGVAEAGVFSTVAAERVAAAWGRSVTGVIGGIPGYDSGQSLRELDQHGRLIAPDWVVIGTLWSDLYRNDGARTGTNAAAADARLEAPRRLAAWRVGRILLAPWLLSRKVSWAEHAEDIGTEGNNRVPLPTYVRNLDALAARARALGAQPVFLTLAAPMDLDAAPVPEPVQEYRLAMRRAAERADAPLVDGPAWFRDHGATIGHFLDQVHPSAAGHLLLGEALAETLLALGAPAGAQGTPQAQGATPQAQGATPQAQGATPQAP